MTVGNAKRTDESPIDVLGQAMWEACSDRGVMEIHADSWKELNDIATSVDHALRARGWRLYWNGVSDADLDSAFDALRQARHPYTCGDCRWEGTTQAAYFAHLLKHKHDHWEAVQEIVKTWVESNPCDKCGSIDYTVPHLDGESYFYRRLDGSLTELVERPQ